MHEDTCAVGEAGASIKLNASFPTIDWKFQQSVYGWPALQYQAFAQGLLIVTGKNSCRISLHTDNVLELAVNDKSFFGGDFYCFRRAPLILTLSPGENRITIRLIRDVRAMGGVGNPSVSVRLNVQHCTSTLKIVLKSSIIPDLVGGNFVTSYASVIVRNESEDWLHLLSLKSLPVSIAQPVQINAEPLTQG